MRRSLLAVLFVGTMIVGLAPAAGAAVSVRWTGKVGRALTDVARGPDGSLYAAGIDRSSITAAATLRKFSPSGKLRWERHWVPSPQDSANGVGVAIGRDGTVYLLGVVRGTCEGQGWFVRAYTPGGDLRWKYVTPGWRCRLAEFPGDIAVRGDLLAVAGFSHGCCGDQLHDGWITAFHANLTRRYRANVEPPGAPLGWFDTAWGVAISPGGSIFASGWGATQRIPRETSPTPGTPFLEKLTTHGRKVWSKRANVSMPTMFATVPLGLGDGRAVVGGGVHGFDVSWGVRPTTGWVAGYSLSGDLKWHDTFGGRRDDAAAPTGIGVDGEGRAWVLSTRRDASDRGTDGLVRRYSTGGKLRSKLRIDRSDRYIRTAGIAALGTGAAGTGWIGNEFQFHGGRLWRLAN